MPYGADRAAASREYPNFGRGRKKRPTESGVRISDSEPDGYNPNSRRISSTASRRSQPKNSISRSTSLPFSNTFTVFL